MLHVTKRILSLFSLLTVAAILLPQMAHLQNLPPVEITIFDSAATDGYFFMSPYTNGSFGAYNRSHMILDQYGNVIFYQIVTSPNTNPTIDFKLQPDGRMSYFNTFKGRWYFMDSTFVVTDSIQCLNYTSDQHDIQVLPNHHYLMFGEEMRIMDLSAYHWFGFTHTQPGSTTAQVTGVIIQEFDENKSLVWEWKSLDHYLFGDVDQRWLSNPNKVDWTHANSVEMDHDGNVLISLRHFNEITKIDHATGNIIWRLGGKQNQFLFPNDPLKFTGQHDIRRVSDTSISIFDNGQYTNPAMSRALEYALDETNKVATMAWEYIYDSTKYSLACGNHQYISNGNHLVDFGFWAGINPWMVVVKPDKTPVLKISFPNSFISYRAFNYLSLPWQLNRPVVNCQKIGETYYLEAEPGHSEYRWSTGATSQSIPITATGDYWVFVPYGVGYLSSERITITDPVKPCIVTGINPTAVTEETALWCFPNPASVEVKIGFNLPSASHVVVTLVNELGTEVLGVVDADYPEGSHDVNANLSHLSRGIYILRMVTDQTLVTRKLIVR